MAVSAKVSAKRKGGWSDRNGISLLQRRSKPRSRHLTGGQHASHPDQL